MDLAETLTGLFAHAGRVGLQGTIQFIVAGEEPVWVAAGERVEIHRGCNREAQTQVSVSREHLQSILAGQADVEQLFAAGNVRIQGDLGLATLLPQLIGAAVHANDQQPTPRAEMNRRYPAPPRFSETLSAAQPPLTSIEHRAARELSIEEFKERYESNGIPVIVTEALSDWPLLRMSREQALEQFAQLNGIVRHGDYINTAFSTKRTFRTMPMAQFIANLQEQDGVPDSPPAYMGNNVLPERLLSLIRFPPYFPRELFNAPRLWIGPSGTVTPLHRDASDNLYAQVWGRKSFILAAPHWREPLGTWSTTPEGGLEACEFDPRAPDHARFAGTKAMILLKFEVAAGQLLFLPEGWFHRVESLTPSLSVNFWIRNRRGPA